jgi:hypothetical protein
MYLGSSVIVLKLPLTNMWVTYGLLRKSGLASELTELVEVDEDFNFANLFFFPPKLSIKQINREPNICYCLPIPEIKKTHGLDSVTKKVEKKGGEGICMERKLVLSGTFFFFLYVMNSA